MNGGRDSWNFLGLKRKKKGVFVFGYDGIWDPQQGFLADETLRSHAPLTPCYNTNWLVVDLPL